MNIKIIVAAHKPYWMPKDNMYLPLHVGKENKPDIGFAGDNTGTNISEKNPNFCELTGLYWAWKNLDVDYVGLAHYRRHFSIKYKKDKKESVLTRDQLEPLLAHTDVILPRKCRYYIETIYSHYAHTHDAEHLNITRKILLDKYPGYIKSFDHVMKARSAHMFNMFVMKKSYLNAYCTWLFDILFELERLIDTNGMNSFNARLFGRISEILLNVWILKNNISYREIRYIYMEPVDWKKKILGFLKAKYLKQKYSASW